MLIETLEKNELYVPNVNETNVEPENIEETNEQPQPSEEKADEPEDLKNGEIKVSKLGS